MILQARLKFLTLLPDVRDAVVGCRHGLLVRGYLALELLILPLQVSNGALGPLKLVVSFTVDILEGGKSAWTASADSLCILFLDDWRRLL